MASRKWTIDTTHSNVGFSVRHMMLLKVHGRFGKWSGEIELDEDDVTKSKVNVTIDTSSIDTNDAKRDEHLRSADFFAVDKNKQITFASTKVAKVDDTHLKVTGNLEIAGVTKEVTLDVENVGKGKDPWGNERVAFEGKVTLNRNDFGVKWNASLETGGVLVGEKVEVALDVQATGAK